MVSARRVLTSLLLSTTILGLSPAIGQTTTSTPAGGDAPQAPQPTAAQPDAAPGATAQTDPAQADPAQADSGSEIVVTGRFIPNEKRETSEIVSLLTSEDLARGGDSDIAGALTRVTGLSLIGGKFVYVRGLGGRYSSALLDGAVLPSPEPLRRVVPLDAFPTSLLSGALVQKTYSPEYPGEFAGGLVVLRSQVIPQENFISASISGGVNDTSTFKTGIGFQGGDLDAIGFRDNTYSLPTAVGTNPSLNGFNPGQLQLAGRSLVNNGPGFSLDKFKNYPDFGGDLSFGRRFDIGSMSAGLLLAGTYSQEVRNQNGVRNRYQPSGPDTLGFNQGFSPSLCNGFNTAVLDAASCGLKQTTVTVNVGGIAALGLEVDSATNVNLKTIILRKTDKIGREQRGSVFGDSNNIVDDYLLSLQEQELWINQFNLDHKFELGGFGDSKFGIRGSYDRASRVTPYRTEYRYILGANSPRFTLSRDPNQTSINFTGLRDDNYEAGGDLELKGDPLGFETVFKLGGLYNRKNRGYSSRRYQFTLANGVVANPGLYDQVPEIIFSPDNIGPGGFVISQTDGPANSYDAVQETYGGYFTSEWQIAKAIRITAGARFEHSKQVVTGAIAGVLPPGGRCVATGATANFVQPLQCTLSADRLLPAATVTFEFADNMQLRAGYSRTLSRPDLRELSPAVLYNIEEDVEEQGDPNLRITQIDNFDARYEWYFGPKQLLSLGGFYKKLKDPIERSLSNFGDDYRRQYINAGSAEVYGGEAELNLTVPWESWFSGDFFADRRAFLIGNLTYSKSTLTIDAAQRGILTSASRPLEGQSEWLGNIQIGYDMKGERLAFLFNYAGKRISDIGVFGAPDVYEKPPKDFDFTYAKTFPVGGREVEFSVKIQNILDQGFLRTQGGLVYESYSIGRSYSAGLRVTF